MLADPYEVVAGALRAGSLLTIGTSPSSHAASGGLPISDTPRSERLTSEGNSLRNIL